MDLIVGENSYITIEEANEIVLNNYTYISEEKQVWDSLSEEDKKVVILKATKTINKEIFRGCKYTTGKLAWPRIIDGVYVECPDDVKDGIIAQAIKSIEVEHSDEYKLKEKGVKSYSVKNASITFSDNTDRLKSGVFESVYREYLINWVY